eukprot:1811981-Rhodomonas_salina.8
MSEHAMRPLDERGPQALVRERTSDHSFPTRSLTRLPRFASGSSCKSSPRPLPLPAPSLFAADVSAPACPLLCLFDPLRADAASSRSSSASPARCFRPFPLRA